MMVVLGRRNGMNVGQCDLEGLVVHEGCRTKTNEGIYGQGFGMYGVWG